MLRYFISLFCILLTLGTYSQSKPIDLNPKDTVAHKQSYGLRIGIDLSRPIISQLDNSYNGIEAIADYRISNNIYLAVELGREEKNKQEDLFNFTTTGQYYKLGLNKNNYANWYGERNLIYIGGRIAYSRFNNTLNNYSYFNSNRYWNPEEFTIGSTEQETLTGLSATWLEFVFGTQVELLKNIYMGASVRIGYIISQKSNDRLPNLYIPGFNKVTEGSRFGVGFNYSLSYYLPFYNKEKKKIQKIEEIEVEK